MGLQKTTKSAQDAENVLSALDETFDTANLEEQIVQLLAGLMHIAEEADEDFSQCLVLAEEAYELEITDS